MYRYVTESTDCWLLCILTSLWIYTFPCLYTIPVIRLGCTHTHCGSMYTNWLVYIQTTNQTLPATYICRDGNFFFPISFQNLKSIPEKSRLGSTEKKRYANEYVLIVSLHITDMSRNKKLCTYMYPHQLKKAYIWLIKNERWWVFGILHMTSLVFRLLPITIGFLRISPMIRTYLFVFSYIWLLLEVHFISQTQWTMRNSTGVRVS